ncbi:MAG: GNAT family N-acetyltransferase, partial [SAR324 cluster bacterium]|nr:GNAT family N-acetyltransferase [SAR324 cluster bacterium]
SIRGSDASSVLELFNSLSDKKVYPRYFAPSGARVSPSFSAVERICLPNRARIISLVVCIEEWGVSKVLGIGSCIRDSVNPYHASLTLAVHESWQGKGVGTILVEHLALLGEKHGIQQFEGFVLSEDKKILEVLRHSGLRGTRVYKGDEVQIELSTEETPEFRHASIEREMRATANSLDTFFNSESVAVIGASRRPGSIGAALVSNLLQAGFKGKIYPINPSASEISGLRSFRSVEDVPGDVELSIIAVHAPDVEETIAQCIRKGVKGVVVISSGFAELSVEGRETEKRIVKMARGAGMRLIGPNCVGIVNTDPKHPIYGVFAGVYPPAGNIAMVSQSGALGIAILDYVSTYHLGISNFVSIGNKADVSVNDLLSYWAYDERTKVIALYLESFGNPEKFARIAPELARRKPMVAVKSGRTAAGSRAASSHSASLANVDVAVDAIFDQAGVIRTNTLEELFDVAKVLSSQPLPAGPRVGVVTNAGGPGILLADALEVRGLKLPTLSNESLVKLKKILPFQAGLANPIDMLAYAEGNLYEEVIKIVGADENVDSLIVIYVPPIITDPHDVASGIARGACSISLKKPLLTVFLSSSEHVPKEFENGPHGQIPVFVFPENAAQALSAVEKYARWREEPMGEVLTLSPEEKTLARKIIDEVLAENSAEQWLEGQRVQDLLKAVGIQFVSSRVVEPSRIEEVSEKLTYPLVLKVLSPEVLHKSDVGGVILGIKNKKELLNAAKNVTQKMHNIGARVEGFQLQQEVQGGVEFLVGVTTDAVFGHLIVVGLGGIFVELFKDVAFSLPPVTDVRVKALLDKLRAKKLLEGFRGSEKVDRKALEDVIMRVSALIELIPEIRELDLNPVKILPEGSGAVTVDARIKIAGN